MLQATKSEYRYISTISKKITALNMIGGKCQRCSESRHWCLSFHHLDRKLKTTNPGHLLQYRYSMFEKEISNCIVLCENCHREEHYFGYTPPDLRFRETKKVLLSYKKTSKCSKCNYSTCIGSLNFMHLDGSEKDFYIGTCSKKSVRVKAIEDIPIGLAAEIDKCIVVCSNCLLNNNFDYMKFESFKERILCWASTYKETPPKIDRGEIIRLKELGYTNAEVSRELGCTKSTITYALKKIELGKF